MTRQVNDGTGSHPDLGARVVPSVVAPARDPLPKGPHGPAPLNSRVGDGSAGPALSPIASSQAGYISNRRTLFARTGLPCLPGGYGPRGSGIRYRPTAGACSVESAPDSAAIPSNEEDPGVLSARA